MSLPLFDIPMQKGAGIETGRPVDAGDAHLRSRASSDHAVEAPPQGLSRSATDGVRRALGSEIPLQFADGSAIRRTVIHRYGAFLHLQRCPSPPCACAATHPPREFRVLELQDGRVLDEFLDTGERVKSRFSREEVEQGLREKKFREVPA